MVRNNMRVRNKQSIVEWREKNGVAHDEEETSNNVCHAEEVNDTDFEIRESPLTELMKNSPHTRAIYHIFIAILAVLMFDTVVHDLVERGKINIGLNSIAKGFGNINQGAKLWLFDLTIILAFYPALRFYGLLGRTSKKYPVLRGFLPTLGAVGLVAAHITLMSILWPLGKMQLRVGSSLVVTIEMFRFMMKLHAVAVACGPRYLDGSSPLPSFKHYVYFLFAPTLIYRDQYPRTKRTKWGDVLIYFLEVVAIIFCYSFLWERFILPYWSDYGKQRTVEAGTVVRGMFACVLPGILCYLCSFYVVLHVWQNAFAEMLRFGDRVFYEDWWNTSYFSRYYRYWNRVVHSWLRLHIYEVFFPKLGRTLSTLIVFFISSVAHEIILASSFGFFYPVLMLQYNITGVIILIPLATTCGRRFPNIFNFLLWLGYFFGNGLLWSLYPMEYFARKNCPPSENDNFFVPKSWTCPQITLKPNWTFENPFEIY